MIKFSNKIIAKALQDSILSYNNSSLDDEVRRGSFTYDELTGDAFFSKEQLKELKDFRLFINNQSMESGEIEIFIDELKKVLENTNFSNFDLGIQSKNHKKPIFPDLSFLEKLSPNLTELYVFNLDLSNLNSESLKKFTNLKMLHLVGNNIKNPKVFSDLNEDCSIFLFNPIEEEKYSDEVIKLISKHKGNVKGLQKFYMLADAVRIKQTILDRYLQLESKFNFSTLENFKILINGEVDLNDENIISKIKKLNSFKNITLVSNAANYLKLHEYIPDLPVDININNVSELSFKDLGKLKNIQSVVITDGIERISGISYMYTRDKYLSITKRIDEIISGIQKANNSLGISEKEIFAKIYKRLAKEITYDYYAITKEGKKDKVVQRDCRNLYGGLVQGQCVCAGYATILKNILSCVGIESYYLDGIYESSKSVEEKTSENNNNISGHAWNVVKLDGEYFNTDLTWDRDFIVSGKTPKFFLKSDKDFNHNEYRDISRYKPDCKKSIDKKETQRLIYKTKLNTLEEKENPSDHDYLRNAVKKAASLGLRMNNFFNIPQILNIKKDKDKDKNEDKNIDENTDRNKDEKIDKNQWFEER